MLWHCLRLCPIPLVSCGPQNLSAPSKGIHVFYFTIHLHNIVDPHAQPVGSLRGRILVFSKSSDSCYFLEVVFLAHLHYAVVALFTGEGNQRWSSTQPGALNNGRRWTALDKQFVFSRYICLGSPGNLGIGESTVPGKHHAVHVGQAAAWREDAIPLHR